jgi:hypothetical protein
MGVNFEAEVRTPSASDLAQVVAHTGLPVLDTGQDCVLGWQNRIGSVGKMLRHPWHEYRCGRPELPKKPLPRGECRSQRRA